MRIAVFNVGSSSVKSALFDLPGVFPNGAVEPVWKSESHWDRRKEPAGCAVRRVIEQMPPGAVTAGVHRVVHGGAVFSRPVLIDTNVKAEIARLRAFAPEHNGAQLEAIEAAEQTFGPGTPHVAVFDTAFHATIPDVASTYPCPLEWFGQGIRRYGFHGISHGYAARRGAELAGRPLDSLRVITCHLGHGASLCAVRNGASVDTTMGFTPLEGLMMGTRSGTLDPGIVIHLVRSGWTADKLNLVLNRESGLKGVSGISGDMRDILEHMRNGDARARLAFDLYLHRLCRELGGMLSSAGGLDLLVFTGGIGENCPELRERICAGFGFLGITVDDGANRRVHADGLISALDSQVAVAVVRAREDVEMARSCWELLRS